MVTDQQPRMPLIQEAPLIRDQVYQVLLTKLISGELAPGDKITERLTASELGISTTPVKEALRRLENEGFVRTIPRRGIVVGENALTSFEQVITVRAWLEGLAARLCAVRVAAGEIDGPTLEALTVPLALMKDPILRPVDEIVGINASFHEAIRELSGNRVIVQFVGTLLGVDAAVRKRALADPEELQRGNAEHIDVGDAILDGDADRAEALMRSHVLRSGDHTLHAGPS
ncbi:GntR family transcriptional regulator [Jiangella mangrovi]|uniref:DNA-binding GntR family transcriptional regulator n=1 Tax=Jiangella mangrovi TaxID=1524084 RepID=A0A7W9GWS2_9ACTN|nr:GntR family transcriptional regulator [Jiangella mangrovi]MBB5791206.1 DNA-binding GntR family transcriptional regulator [Jiangella mangrovi]